MHLKEKVALVTGGASGIGKAAAQKLARHGVRVAIIDFSSDDLTATCDEFGKQGLEVLPLAADISQPSQLERAVRNVADRWCRIDIVFANAGINGVWAPLEHLDPSEWDRTLNINLKGTFLTIKYTAPFLKMQGGSVIITSSVNGTRIFSNTGATAYSCSKAGQVAMGKMLALELAKFNVRVNVICPGAIKTQISKSTEVREVQEVKPKVEFPEGAMPLTHGEPGTPEDVADLVLFLASKESKLISGSVIYTDGAQSLLMG